MLTGRCNCGAVRFEVTEPPEDAGYCHCTRCQRRTGGASSAQAHLAPGSLRLTGEEALRSWQPEGGYAKVFCGECGSSLFSGPSPAELTSVRLGAFDGDPGVRPSYRQRLDTAAAWEPVPDDGLERFEGPRPR